MRNSDVVTKDGSVIIWAVCVKDEFEEWFHSAYVTRSRAKTMSSWVSTENDGKVIIRKMVARRADAGV